MTRKAALGLVLVLLLGALTLAAVPPGEDLERAWANPPDVVKVWAYWWWLDGAASREGITRDLEEMKKQGIAGVLLFDAGMGGPEAPKGAVFMSPAWRELYKHALAEAARLGIEVGVNLCSGWNAGGTWVTAEHAAKRLVHSRVIVEGPGSAPRALRRPAPKGAFYQDIAVLAYPLPASAPSEPRLTASSSYQDYGPEQAEDGMAETRWVSNGHRPGMGPTPEKPEFLQFEYAKPEPRAVLYLKPYRDCGPREIEIQSSEDGKAFHPLRRLTIENGKETTEAFDEARARYFRVVFLSSYPFHGSNWNVQVDEIALLGKDEKMTARGIVLDHARLLDLTSRMDAEGRLDWDVPAGRWEVLRLGYTLWGRQTKCASPGSQGYEIDFLDARAMDLHFAHTGDVLAKDARDMLGKTLKYFHIDSHEAGSPTWTPRFREEFTARRGYDPLCYLPAMAGRTVDSPEITARFLWDVDRTVADLFAANHYGRLRELSQRYGLGTHPESGGPPPYTIDGLQTEGINDIPMGEFWKRNQEPDGPVHNTIYTLRQAAVAAHIYGKPLCQAEAFTSFGDDWIDDPWSMKDIGDMAFCEGLTRNVLCFYVHQPRLDVKPGFQWAHVGTHFDRNITWWDKSHAWLAYLARCQQLLRQGQFSADFAYFYGEGGDNYVPEKKDLQPALPPGFDSDVLNSEVLLGRARAEEGRLALASGMRYRYLVLMTERTAAMSAQALRKMRELVEGGVTLVGERPQHAPGLTDYPECDHEVKAVSDALWGPAPALSGTRTVGKGRVIWGKALDAVVRDDGLTPDFEVATESARDGICWIHRGGDGWDTYFVANTRPETVLATCRFRVGAGQPELWDAVTGEIRDLPEYGEEGGQTTVSMVFAPRQSFFVVFRKKGSGFGVQGSGKNFPEVRIMGQIAGPWEVAFDPKWGGPEQVSFDSLTDWTRRPEEGIKYYSGTATYSKTFDLTEGAAGRRLFLDLGTVKNVAEVRLNGKDLGVAWTAPWRVDITKAVEPKGNRLQIDVVNLWPNRLIGDGLLPKDKRRTVTNVRTYDSVLPPETEYRTYRCTVCEDRRNTGKPAALLPSGLLGPVTIQAESQIDRIRN